MTDQELIGVHSDIPNEDYHSGPGISSSVVKSMGKSPAYCWANNLDPERTRSTNPAFILGTQTHTAILEPEKFWDENIMSPDADKRTKAGKAIWADFYENQGSRVEIKPEAYEQMLKMHEAVYAHPVAGDMLRGDLDIEESGYWLDERTGLLCKYRPDARSDEYVIDVKTAQDGSLDGFSRSCANFGYFNSASWYLDGEAACRGVDHKRFIWIVVEKTHPFQVSVYYACPLSLELASRQNAHWLRQLALCIESGVWNSYNDNEMMELSLPAWELKKLN